VKLGVVSEMAGIQPITANVRLRKVGETWRGRVPRCADEGALPDLSQWEARTSKVAVLGSGRFDDRRSRTYGATR
jgi:hypothetical protein